METKFTPEQIEERLRAIFEESCEKQSVPESIRQLIIENGLQHFTYGVTGVEPLGDYPNIFECIRLQAEDMVSLSPKEPEKQTKETLLLRLINLAESGDLINYRKVRAVYSTAS